MKIYVLQYENRKENIIIFFNNDNVNLKHTLPFAEFFSSFIISPNYRHIPIEAAFLFNTVNIQFS